MEQVKSGLMIVIKMLIAFGVAVTFMAGCALIRMPGNLQRMVIGWLLLIVSIVVMTTTVKFWAAGFFGLVAYGAFRSLGGILISPPVHMSRLYMVSVSASIFVMTFLCFGIALNEGHVRATERVSVVIAASCVLMAVLAGDSYKSVAAFNIGNVALFLSWQIARTRRRRRRKSHTIPTLSA
jgi:hypothetical protein